MAIDAAFRSLASSEYPAATRELHVAGLTPLVLPQRNASQSSVFESYTRPGSIARFGTTCPAPWRKISTGLVFGAGVPPSSTSVAEVISADLIIIGDQSSCRSFSSAARPATCGDDIDVPL